MIRQRKLKFRPRLARIRLSPEQAVLACSCYSSGGAWRTGYPDPMYYSPLEYTQGVDALYDSPPSITSLPGCGTYVGKARRVLYGNIKLYPNYRYTLYDGTGSSQWTVSS